MPWKGDEPGLGFSPTGATWLPQPDSYRDLAVDRQVDVPGSTWSLYRDALAARKRLGLGRGEIAWVDAPDHIVAFDNGAVRVMTNVLGAPVPLPSGYAVLLSSVDIDGDELPTDATVWLTAI